MPSYNIAPQWTAEVDTAGWGTLPTADDSSIGTDLVAWKKFQYLLKKSVLAGKLSSTDIVSTYSLVYTTSTAYIGSGCLAPNGDIHFAPYFATVGQKISASGIVSTYSIISNLYHGGVLSSTGDIHFVPQGAAVGQKISPSGVVSTYDLINSVGSTPTYVTGTNYDLATGTSFAYPTGIVAGDFIIVAQSNDGGDVSAVPTDASATTYSTLVQYTGSNPDYLISYKFAAGTESGNNISISNISSRGSAVIQVFRNIFNTPFDTTFTSAGGATGDPNPPSITTVSDNTLIVAIGFLDDDSGVTVTEPSGYSNLNYGESMVASGSDSVTMMASKLLSSAGTETPGAFTTSGDDEWRAVTIALRSKSVSSYAGGVLAPNGDIHFSPRSSPVGQKVSASGVVSTYSLVYTTTNAYTSGVISPNGDIHFIPDQASVGQKISAAGVISTYSLVYTAALGSAYIGGVLSVDGDIHFVPSVATVGQKVSPSGVVSTYNLAYTTANAYWGGVLAPNGDIHFVPNFSSIGQKISASGVASTYNLPYTTVEGYNGGTLGVDGNIYFIPRNADRGMKINTLSAIPFDASIARSPWVNKV